MIINSSTTISTLDDLDLLSSCDGEGETRLYRGLSTLYPRSLVPGIFRPLSKGDKHPRKLEDELLSRLRKEADGMVRSHPTSEYEWRAIAQHHGMSTRLLDWTEDASVALWFALEKEETPDPCIWTFVVDMNDVPEHQKDGFRALPASSNRAAIDEGQVSEARSMSSGRGHAGRTLVFRHLTTCSRIVAQKGWFMNFPDRKQCAEGLPTPFEQNENPSYLGKVVRWVIDRSRRERLLADLDAKGINRDSLFPEHGATCDSKLDELCCVLNDEWRRGRRDWQCES